MTSSDVLSVEEMVAVMSIGLYLMQLKAFRQRHVMGLGQADD